MPVSPSSSAATHGRPCRLDWTNNKLTATGSRVRLLVEIHSCLHQMILIKLKSTSWLRPAVSLSPCQ
jgi:hypothetical protein